MQRATRRGVDGRDAPPVDLDAVDLVLEQDLAAGLGGDARHDRVDELAIVLPRIEGAASVRGDQCRVQQERHPRRWQQVVAALAGQDGAKTRGETELRRRVGPESSRASG